MSVKTPFLAKVTFFFSDGRYGWSENYFCIGSQKSGAPSGVLDPWGVLSNAFPLARARANFLALQSTTCSQGIIAATVGAPGLEYIRISQVGQPRNTAYYTPYGGEIVGSNIPAGQPSSQGLRTDTQLATFAADNPYSAVEMECTLGNGLTVKRAMSGFPDGMICDQSWGAGNPAYTLWKKFAKILTNGVWGVASSSIVANNVNVAGAVPIENIAQNVQGQPQLSVSTIFQLNTGNNGCPIFSVQIFCYKSAPGRYPNLNGVWPVANIVPGTSALQIITLNRVLKPISAARYGSVIPYAGPSFSPFINVELTGTMNKKRGRPFGLRAGRAALTR